MLSSEPALVVVTERLRAAILHNLLAALDAVGHKTLPSVLTRFRIRKAGGLLATWRDGHDRRQTLSRCPTRLGARSLSIFHSYYLSIPPTLMTLGTWSPSILFYTTPTPMTLSHRLLVSLGVFSRHGRRDVNEPSRTSYISTDASLIFLCPWTTLQLHHLITHETSLRFWTTNYHSLVIPLT